MARSDVQPKDAVGEARNEDVAGFVKDRTDQFCVVLHHHAVSCVAGSKATIFSQIHVSPRTMLFWIASRKPPCVGWNPLLCVGVNTNMVRSICGG